MNLAGVEKAEQFRLHCCVGIERMALLRKKLPTLPAMQQNAAARLGAILCARQVSLDSPNEVCRAASYRGFRRNGCLKLP